MATVLIPIVSQKEVHIFLRLQRLSLLQLICAASQGVHDSVFEFRFSSKERSLHVSESFTKWCQAARKTPGPVMWFPSVQSSLPAAQGWLFYFLYLVYLSQYEI
jgi:hypothetical protein